MALAAASNLAVKQLLQFPLPYKTLNSVFSYPINQFKSSSLKNCIPNTLRGTYFQVSPKKAIRFKIRDNVPENYVLIYNAPFELMIRVSYPLSLFFSLTAPVYLVSKYLLEGKSAFLHELNFTKPNTINFASNPVLEASLFVAALLVMATGMVSVMFKYPFRMYKHNVRNEYIAIFLSAIPTQLRQVHFKSVVKRKFRNPLYFFVPDCHYFLERRKAILFGHHFRTTRDLLELIGLD